MIRVSTRLENLVRRRSTAWIQLLAVVLGVLPLYSSLILAGLLNLRPGTLSSDLLAALTLCPVIIVASVISTGAASDRFC